MANLDDQLAALATMSSAQLRAQWASVTGSPVPRVFTQERVATSANLVLEGLLSDEHRKTGWMRAEAAGDPGPWRQQAILGPGALGRGRAARHRARDRKSTRLNSSHPRLSRMPSSA